MRRLLLTLAATLAASGALAQQSALVGPLQPYNNLADLSVIGTSRTNLGLGTAATLNTGTSGATLCLLSGNCTWANNSGPQYTDGAGFTSGATGAAMFAAGTGAGAALYLDSYTGSNVIFRGNNYAINAKVTGNGLVIRKLPAAPATAPGGEFVALFAVAGTNAGTCKLQVMAGTSTTPITIVDNIGSGC